MYLGIDLGGTNIAVGLVDAQCKILKQNSRPTNAPRSYQEIVKDMAELCREVTESAGYTMADIKGIGVGTPGSVESKTGTVVYGNNLDWYNVPLAEELQKHFPGMPIAVENDANAAAYGEYMATGGNTDSFVAVTLGTGVGGGIILNKKIFRGFNGAAGELGHFTLIHNGEPCTCGKKGCWESYASVTALIQQTQAAIAENPDTLMARYAQENGKINGRTAFDAAKAGDSVAQKVVDQYISYIADGVVSMVNIFEPEILVIGGGISAEGEYLMAPIRKHVEEFAYSKGLPQTELRIASLANDAGIIGAAMAAVAE
ncbi:MAG: ROK family protein [Clostridia bacterium]|nr:ROK family protein [Clostridia bacterium]